MAFYLDPLTAESGPLRFIPGSHWYGERLQQTAYTGGSRRLNANFGFEGPSVPAAAIKTEQGDVVVFHQSLKHNSGGGGTRRRMLTINCGHRYQENEMEFLMDELKLVSGSSNGIVYGEKMLATAGPKRMRHLEQALKLAPEGVWTEEQPLQ